MFLDYKVPIPDSPGKIVRKNRGGNTYIEYEYDRSYDATKQYTYPKRASIGRLDPDDPTKMTPNENYLKYFGDEELPREHSRDRRSPYLNIGPYVVLHKVVVDYKLEQLLTKYHLREQRRTVLSGLRLYPSAVHSGHEDVHGFEGVGSPEGAETRNNHRISE